MDLSGATLTRTVSSWTRPPGSLAVRSRQKTLGEAAFGGPAPGVGTPAQRQDGLNRAAGDELGDDAPDGGVGALLAHERAELGAAPHGEIEAQALDRLDETGWADRLAQARRPAAARLEALLPAIKIGARLTDRTRRAIAGEPVGHGSPPSRDARKP